MKNETTTS